MTGILVTMQHARAASLSGQRVLCARGVYAWCARYNIDLHMLCHEGVPIEQFEAIDDAFAQRMVAIARECYKESHNG